MQLYPENIVSDALPSTSKLIFLMPITTKSKHGKGIRVMLARFLSNIVEFVEQEHQITEANKLLKEFLYIIFKQNPEDTSIKLLDQSDESCCIQIDIPFPSHLSGYLVLDAKNTTRIIQTVPLTIEILKACIEEPFKAYLKELKDKNDPVYLNYQIQSKTVFEERKQMVNEDVRQEDKDRKVLTKGKEQTMFGNSSIPVTETYPRPMPVIAYH